MPSTKFALGLAGVLFAAMHGQALGAADALDGLRAIRDQAAEIEAGAGAEESPAWLWPASPSVAACDDQGQPCGPPPTAGSPAASAATGPDIVYTVFVSRSLGAEALRAVFQAARGPDVRIVFRGVKPDEPMTEAIRAIQSLLNDLDPLPNVALDPTPFRDAGITAVPVVVARGAAGELARVSGLSAPDWLRAKVRAGTRGDLGVRGPVVAIGEPDLIEELQRRLAALDPNKMREGAIGRYWQRAAFETLPPVTEARERMIDPTVTASADLVLPDGTPMIHAGDTVNPLEHLPFTQRLVIFDASDPRQVETARRLGQTAGARRPLYLATALERARGWEGLRTVEDRLDEPVYLLTPDVRTRFALERVPSMVETRGRVFAVTEVPVDNGSGVPR
jgi:conjugal transfer pilus assembly protein TraW